MESVFAEQDSRELYLRSQYMWIPAGVKRQRVEYMLPVKVDGEAGGLREEFKAARDMVEATLVRLKKVPGFTVSVSQK